MTEMDSGAPKRTPRPRRQKVQSTEQVESGELLETGMAEARPLKPVIEDVLEEIAAARAEFEQSPPSERDMDFESTDAPVGEGETDREPGANGEGNGGGGEFAGGDDPNRRRRRRRGRGRGTTGPGDNTGYSQQPAQNQNRPPQRGRNGQGDRRHGQQGQPRRPHDGGGQRGYNNGPPRQQSNEPRSSEPRGPEVLVPVQGTLELHPKGYGFLRDAKAGYVSQETDAFVSGSLIEKYSLREGVHVTGECVSMGRGQGPRLKSVQTIEGRLPELYPAVKKFDDLTPINPFQLIKLETGTTPITMRVMDLLCPIGKGQRALLVAPPRSGKTMLLQEIADSVSKNHPDIYLIVLLIDERPEEVTEMRRRVNGEVVASSLDREVENHVRVSQLVFEKAKRMAESGRDVFLLLDSITRTARAFNKWTNTGRTGTGGLDVKAMDIPKKMFGMARQFDEGGSLTVVGTALIETGGRMDDAIFQEFKGTGNMEMVLSRELAERRIWP
ncbi:MAG: transcription termination factor Rho, partial [Candidatus Saccharimonas sp.]|nr:transcription termination factor Rho [Planctomycetaceae bacterium]